ncbi:MAG: hypothetical protein CVU63_22870, partial [Deltaproteobacteria bacterium HGW-Deltaproteobacteria-20]
MIEVRPLRVNNSGAAMSAGTSPSSSSGSMVSESSCCGAPSRAGTSEDSKDASSWVENRVGLAAPGLIRMMLGSCWAGTRIVSSSSKNESAAGRRSTVRRRYSSKVYVMVRRTGGSPGLVRKPARSVLGAVLFDTAGGTGSGCRGTVV